MRTSYLRVYQPLEAFTPQEQDGWAKGVETDRAPESSVSRRWLLGGFLPGWDARGAPAEGAFVRRVDGRVFVCPWRMRLRMLAGLLAFRNSVPEEVADAFVPAEDALRAARELEALDDSARCHILHVNWHVPLRWFAAFDDSERILTEDSEGLRVRYESSLLKARGRLARAVEVLESSWLDESLTETVRELWEWIEEFGEDGLVELDYGSVAAGFSHEELLDDRSAADVWTCLEAIAVGDVIRAGKIFEGLAERWTQVRVKEVAN